MLYFKYYYVKTSFNSRCYEYLKRTGNLYNAHRADGPAYIYIAAGVVARSTNSFYVFDPRKNRRSQPIQRKQNFCFYNNLIVEDYYKFAKLMQDRYAASFHLPFANDFI